MIPNDTKPHKEITILKSDMPTLPVEFEEIPDYLGDKKDSLRQYRGPQNIHILEYEDHWKAHWDWGDPRSLDGFLIHIFADAPEVGLALVAATLAGKEKYEETKSVPEAVFRALLAGFFTFVGVAITKEIIKWLISFFSERI